MARADRLTQRPPVHSYTVPLPSPFADRQGNAYLLTSGEGGAVLVDPGPDRPEVRQSMDEALAAVGLGPTALRAVVLTGWEPERSGLVAWLGGRLGVTVVARGGASGMALARAAELQRDRAIQVAARWGGAPAEARERISALLEARRAFQPVWQPGVRQRWLDPIPGRNLRLGDGSWIPRRPVLPLAGGSAYWHEASRTLIGGEILDRSPALRLPLPRPLQDWPDILGQVLASWRQLGRETIDLVLPAQGAPIRSHRMWIARRLAQLKLQLVSILEAAAQEALPPWELLLRLDPEGQGEADLPERLAGLLALVAHLERRGRLRREGPAAAARFRSNMGGPSRPARERPPVSKG